MANKYFYIFIIFSLILFLLIVDNAQAQNKTCSVIQLTDGDQDSDSPAVCGNGSGILISSRADLANNGHADQPDLFFVDIRNFNNPVFYQLTNTPESERGPSISGDCSEIAFNSQSNLTGGNLSNFSQLFYADINDPNSPIFTQLTNFTSNEIINGNISGDGTKLAVSSNVDITGMNPDESVEFFIYDHNNLVVPFAQLTNDPTNSGSISSSPISNFDGSRAAFITSQDFIPPGNNANGGRELYLSEISYNPPNIPASTLYQITDFPNGDFRAQGAQFAVGGDYILISSNANITGMNPDENPDFFLVDVTNPATPVFTQITKSNDFTGAFGIIDSTATKMAFETSNPDFTPPGSDTSDQIIFADITNPNAPNIMSLTNFTNDADVDDLSAPDDFSYIAFESDSDLVPGGNSDGSEEVFILLTSNCLVSIPTLSEWGLIAMAGVLGIVGFMVMRRKKVTV